ncbi:isochorismatase family protein [Roseisolibacter sp. H3M3-2]|uniref:isochorismatase family protein n=1 Tax=Roseisolibacter sp. H3M3-2 TaxID=3031323 RepID=UPI0023DCC94B|nr:isochorismatase family protein [Roseisolibacter sp. H3M3-2]MDF1503813.1 isochorismatase family protein [Roseisolibacter sp. H3M3-2]
MDPARLAVVVCDMWDATHCVQAQARAGSLAPRIDALLRALRGRGALVIHAPADCMPFYEGTEARRRAREAPFAAAPRAFAWNWWEDDERAALPASLTDPGGCSCDAPAPCGDGSAPAPWTRQTPRIHVDDARDAVTDDGQETWNLLAERGIADVALVGVHANVCVLSRWYGIRQLVYGGLRPVLCGDLTDAFHRDPRGHAWGNAALLAHVARRWCPVVTGDALLRRLDGASAHARRAGGSTDQVVSHEDA